MYEDQPLISRHLADAHADAWNRIGGPGAFWTGAERVALVASARAAQACDLCAARADAVSPFAVDGVHDDDGSLPAVLVDFVHRISTDPGRMTRAVFDGVVAAGLTAQQYVEAVSVVCSAVIVDTLHVALGLDRPELPAPRDGEPSGIWNTDSVDAGAWVPVLAADGSMADTGMPAVPNIVRSMGLVPGAVELFFLTFRPHYALKDVPLSLSQAQAELVASRVSARNECFY